MWFCFAKGHSDDVCLSSSRLCKCRVGDLFVLNWARVRQVFYVCFDLCLVYGVGICVNVGGVVCVDECLLTLCVACCVIM